MVEELEALEELRLKQGGQLTPQQQQTENELQMQLAQAQQEQHMQHVSPRREGQVKVVVFVVVVVGSGLFVWALENRTSSPFTIHLLMSLFCPPPWFFVPVRSFKCNWNCRGTT